MAGDGGRLEDAAAPGALLGGAGGGGGEDGSKLDRGEALLKRYVRIV